MQMRRWRGRGGLPSVPGICQFPSHLSLSYVAGEAGGEGLRSLDHARVCTCPVLPACPPVARSGRGRAEPELRLGSSSAIAFESYLLLNGTNKDDKGNPS